MPRTRQLKHDFFLNEELAILPAMTRLLFAGLWLLADREGRLEDRPSRIKAQLFPYHDADVECMLLELAYGKFIIRYQAPGGRFLEIANFKKHQHVHPDEKISVIPKNPEIPRDFKTRSEIMPHSSSPSSSTSPSFSPSPTQQPATPQAAVDFSDYRLPNNFGKYGRCFVANVPPDECAFLIQKMRPGPKVRAALEWRMKAKKDEAVGMSSRPEIVKA